ncbi:MAG: hypothetical protein KKA54_13500 [Proteobacteria bacterium]|nr:hypothetical protein [Pseudomonadota bacterium]
MKNLHSRPLAPGVVVRQSSSSIFFINQANELIKNVSECRYFYNADFQVGLPAPFLLGFCPYPSGRLVDTIFCSRDCCNRDKGSFGPLEQKTLVLG